MSDGFFSLDDLDEVDFFMTVLTTPDVTKVLCSWLRTQVPGTTVSPDLIGWSLGDSWVQVTRIGGEGFLWPYRHEDCVVDVDIRAADRDTLHTLRGNVRQQLLNLPNNRTGVEGAIVFHTDEEAVVDIPHTPEEGFRSVVTYAVRLRAA